MLKSLSILLLAALTPHHCEYWPHPPHGAGGASSTGGSSGSSGTAGPGGSSACPDSATLTFTYVSGSFGPIEDPWVFTWPQPEDPNCDAQWERDEATCVVSVDRECFHENVNVGPGLCVAGETCVDEHEVLSAAFEMANGGEGFYNIVFTQTRQSDNVSFTDDGDYDLAVSVP